jgi:hypothetical protein
VPPRVGKWQHLVQQVVSLSEVPDTVSAGTPAGSWVEIQPAEAADTNAKVQARRAYEDPRQATAPELLVDRIWPCGLTNASDALRCLRPVGRS